MFLLTVSLIRFGLSLVGGLALGGCVAVVPVPIQSDTTPHFVTMVYPKHADPGQAPRSANCPVPARSASDTARMVVLINAQRAAHGLSALRSSGKLAQAAHAHACDNAARAVYSHVGSDGSDLGARLRRSGYRMTTAAENTGLGFDSPEKMVGYWMASAGHRANILNPNITELGLGQADGHRPTWVLDFGRSR